MRIPDYDPSTGKDLDMGEEGTLLLVVKSDASPPGTYLLSKGWSSSSGWSVFTNNSEYPAFGLRGTQATDQSTLSSGWPAQFSIFTLRKNENRRLLRTNGNLNFDLLDTGTVTASGEEDLIMGGIDEDGVNKFGQFDLAELLLYDEGLSMDRIESLEGYLAHKWGMETSLPLAHPFSTLPPQFENRPEIQLPVPFYISFGQAQNIQIPTNRSFSQIDVDELPPGLVLDPSSGVLSGTPSTRGNFAVTLTATNQAGSYAQEFEFVVTDYDDWTYELELNVSEYSENEPLSQFPVYLELSESIEGFKYDQFASTDGDDLVFLNSTGSTELPYEVVDWNPDGNSSFWVLLPSLESNLSIMAKWGNPNLSTPPVYTQNGAVWEGYRAVWRFDRDSDVLIRDSAASFHAEPNGFEEVNVPGVIGSGKAFDGENDYIQLPSSSFFPTGTKQASLSFWSNNQNENLVDLTLFHSTSPLGDHLQLQLPASDGAFHWFTGSGSLDETTSAITGFNNNWTYWVFQVDHLSGISKVFKDGDLYASQSGVSQPFGYPVEKFRIGSTTSSEEWWKGMIDEVRITTELESAQKIKSFYNNQKPDAPSFFTFGSVTGPPYFLPDQRAEGFTDQNFSYLVQTFPSDVTFTAVGLPAGLSINGASGEINGTPVKGGNYTITVIAENAHGQKIQTIPMQISEKNDFAQQLVISCENYAGSENLFNFPLKIELNSSIPGFSLRLFSSPYGYDLRFFEDSGKELLHEIETFDINQNRLVAWVKIPELSSSTTFTACWGNDEIAQYPPSYSINGDVWTEEFKGVWHLRTASSSTLTDSTSNRNHLSDPHGKNNLSSIMGGGRSFLGEPDELILAPDSESLRGLVDQKYSFSSWIRLDRLPEERINEAFFALGYDQVHLSLYLMTPLSSFHLNPPDPQF